MYKRREDKAIFCFRTVYTVSKTFPYLIQMRYNRNDNIKCSTFRTANYIRNSTGGYNVYTQAQSQTCEKRGPLHSFRVMAALVLVIIAGLTFGYIFAAYHSLPEVGNNMRPAVSSQVFDSQGKLITILHSDQNRLPIDINKVPQNLQNAFIAAEDNRFYDHIGIDPIGILRAVAANVTHRGIAQGGSTITQQLAKNAFLSQDQTLKRKIQEAMLALELERKYSKRNSRNVHEPDLFRSRRIRYSNSGKDVLQ